MNSARAAVEAPRDPWHTGEGEFLSSLVASLPVLVVVVGGRGRIRYVSPAVERDLGYVPDELVGRRAALLLAPETARAVVRSVRRGLGWQGQVDPLEVRVRAADGTWRVMSVSARRAADTGDDANVVITCQDLTESRVAREALGRSEAMLFQSQKGEVLGRLASGILHDLNNVLTAIKGNAQLLQLDLGHDLGLWQGAEEINVATNRAVSLTRQLLGFIREQEPEMRPVELNPLLMSFRSLLERLVGRRISLDFGLSDASVIVRADASQVEQVLLNLVVNARDAITGQGRIGVRSYATTVRVEDTRPLFPLAPGEYGVFAVRDTGSGMDERTVARIFEPFFTTKAVGEGTGIGLATVAGILRRCGGSIEVVSEPGAGSEFRVYLPRIRMEIPTHAAGAGPEMVGGTETVLLVEDDDAVRRYTELLLRRHGYDVRPAARPEEALSLAIGSPRIDLLLTDLDLPGASGSDLAEHLDGIISGLRVITMSGNAAYEPDIRKPFDAGDLLRAVRSTLDHPVRASA